MDKRDYIDRDVVLTVLKALFDDTSPVGEEQFGLLKAHRVVREAPAADVAPVVHGEWQIGESGCMYFCSKCELWAFPRESREWNFCPRCGAKMDGGKTHTLSEIKKELGLEQEGDR